MSVMRSRLFAAVLATAYVLGAGALAPPIASAGLGTETGQEPGLNEDSELYAAEYGVSVEEAHRRLSLQSELSVIIDRLEAAAGGRFAGAWIEHQPEYRIVVRVTGSADSALRSASVTSPVPVEVRSDAAASMSDLLADQDRIHEALGELSPGATSEVDLRHGELLVHLPLLTTETARAALVTELDRVADVPVRAEIEATPDLDHTYGGKRISNCTTGFTVRNGAGTTGVATAGHCLGANTYYETTTTSYPAPLVSRFQDPYRDVQWHTTSHPELPQFNANGTLRTVTGTMPWSLQDAGLWVCHQGKTTGYSCGTIQTVQYKPAWGWCSPNCSSTWIKVTGSTLECDGGDSGGPWFNSGTAYGIHTGSAGTPTNCLYALYWAISYISGAGLTVLTD